MTAGSELVERRVHAHRVSGHDDVRHQVRCKRHLYVTIDRCSRSLHLAVKDDETKNSAIAFLREAVAAFTFASPMC